MIRIREAEEMALLKSISIDQILPDLKKGLVVNCFGNLRVRAKTPQIFLAKIDKGLIMTSMVFVRGLKGYETKFISTSIKLIGYLYSMPFCEIMNQKPININEKEIIDYVVNILSKELNDSVDISNIIKYSTESVLRWNYDPREIIDNLFVEDVLIDIEGARLILVFKSVPIPDKIAIIHRNLYVAAIVNIESREIEDTVITVMGHVEE